MQPRWAFGRGPIPSTTLRTGSFAFSARGWESITPRQQCFQIRQSISDILGTEHNMGIEFLHSHPCKKRKDGAPFVQYESRRSRPKPWPPALLNQQMNMFRHDHISDNNKPIALADLFQNLQEAVALSGFTKQRLSSVTRTRDKVQVMSAVETLQAGRHGKPIVSAV